MVFMQKQIKPAQQKDSRNSRLAPLLMMNPHKAVEHTAGVPFSLILKQKFKNVDNKVNDVSQTDFNKLKKHDVKSPIFEHFIFL